MRTGRTLFVVVGAMLSLVGLGVIAVGIGATWVHATQRDADGYLTTPSYEIAADGYAVVTEEVTLDFEPSEWWPEPRELDLRVDVTAAGEGDAVFVGLGDADDVARYLDGVAVDELERLGTAPDDVATRPGAGGAPAAPPGEVGFWQSSVEGIGTQTLTIEPAPGRWTLVVMNADATPGIEVVADLGVRTSLLLPFGVGMALIGLVVVGLGTAALVLGAVTPADDETDAAPTVRVDEPTGARTHPVLLEGRLDPDLSRGLWLVKWLLAIPHMVALAFLWAAFVLLTAVAGVAILFTGRYPRGIFDFNVGVMRWTWRVAYYAYGVLGTDRYPPFSLAHDPDYPATLDVDYPEELSRGLVLVKWWLLALPHYIVVGIFTGGLVSWTVEMGGPEGAEAVVSTGLVGVLVTVAAVVLLVAGSYPRQLFDLVLGLQRWVYRVFAYAALMTDEYPPFRLDTGGAEPRVPTAPPPAVPPGSGTEAQLTNA